MWGRTNLRAMFETKVGSQSPPFGDRPPSTAAAGDQLIEVGAERHDSLGYEGP